MYNEHFMTSQLIFVRMSNTIDTDSVSRRYNYCYDELTVNFYHLLEIFYFVIVMFSSFITFYINRRIIGIISHAFNRKFRR